MATYSKFWKVWLRPNLLTKDVDNDYFAEVSTVKNTLYTEDIARRIGKEGSEIKYDTLVSIMMQHDRIICEAVQDGYSVMTGFCRVAPRVGGSWIGRNAVFDPLMHKVTADLTPAIDLVRALETVGVEVLGVKDDGGAYIGLVEDTLTGLTNDTATIGEDIRIEGNKVKVEGDSEEIGIFFVNGAGVATKVTRRFTQNTHKVVIARIPASLEAGTYQLRIVTQHTGGGYLKEPRTIEYANPLTLVKAEEEA